MIYCDAINVIQIININNCTPPDSYYLNIYIFQVIFRVLFCWWYRFWVLLSVSVVKHCGGEREIWYCSQLHELLTALCTSLTNDVSDTCRLQQPHSPDGTRTCWVGGCWDVPAGMLCSSVVLGGCEKRLHLNCLRFGFHFSFRTMKRSSFAPDGEAAESSFKVICGNILVSAE